MPSAAERWEAASVLAGVERIWAVKQRMRAARRRVSRAWFVGWLLAVSAWAGAAENLIENPGFEAVSVGRPLFWHLLVMPDAGARGGVDDKIVFEGRYSVMLHNPRPYEEEPYNNWSQNIIGDIRGKTLAVRGHIKTEGACEAAIWLQCWRNEPRGMVHVASTGHPSPVRGTQDWTRVEMKVAVPTDVDFAVIRCVLQGAGTVWFDGIAVSELAQSEEAPLSDQMRKGPGAYDSEDADAAIENMTEVGNSITEAIEGLRERSETLVNQINELREEILRLQRRIRADNMPAKPTPPGSPGESSAPQRHVPPLVPHGYNLEDAP